MKVGPFLHQEVLMKCLLSMTLLLRACAAPAAAACRWEWDCSNGYPCRQGQLCDNTLDLPAIRPPGISPIPPPSIAPIPRPIVPPIGTSQCRPAYVCTGGFCSWQTVCQLLFSESLPPTLGRARGEFLLRHVD